MNIREKGKYGENLTVEYLKNHNVDIITTNYHSRYGEIDVIAKDDKFIMFVEVKLRKKGAMVNAGEAVVKSKQQKIIKTAYDYLLKNKFELQPRFDVSKIEISEKNEVSLCYIKNAFYQNENYAAF